MTGPGSQDPFYGSNSTVPIYLLAHNINAKRMGRKVVARYEEIKANHTNQTPDPRCGMLLSKCATNMKATKKKPMAQSRSRFLQVRCRVESTGIPSTDQGKGKKDNEQ